MVGLGGKGDAVAGSVEKKELCLDSGWKAKRGGGGWGWG